MLLQLRNFLLVFMLLTLVSFFTAGGAAAKNKDTVGHWAEKTVETAVELGIAAGYSEESFAPDLPVSRSEFVKMAVVAGGLPPAKSTASPAFKDLGPEHWAFPYVEAAVAARVVDPGGYPEGAFAPDEAITRGEVAALAGRILFVRRGLELPAAGAEAVEDWPALMAGEGVLSGYPGGILEEKRTATRAEACTVALRLKEKLLAAEAAAECRWLASVQSPDGYFTLAGARPDVIPYFDNLTALALCDEPLYQNAVKKYIEWCLSRLNSPDRLGLAGTVYDYREVKGGPLLSTGNYDSADSYAATLLSLTAAYYKNTGDEEFVKKHFRDLSAVAAVVVTLQDSDGMVWAKPGLQVKYLMDNCECFRGLSDWAGVLSSLGYKDLAALYGRKADAIKRAVETRFWNEDEACFAWAVDREGKTYMPEGRTYPGVFAQVYPVVYGVISPESGKAIIAYRRFCQELPEWPALRLKDTYPWTILGFAAVMMDDLAGASQFLNNCRIAYIEKGRGLPWTTFEGGFYARAVKLLREKILAGRL